MRGLIAAALSLCFLLCVSEARAFHNEPDGFRGIPWGTPVDEVRAKVETWFNRDVGLGIIEYRSRDNLTMNTVKLNYNFYQFYQGRFSAGIMEAYTGQCGNMMAVLIARFGQPDDHLTRDRYVWRGDITTIVFIHNRHRNRCRVGLQSTKLMHERENAIESNVDKETDF